MLDNPPHGSQVYQHQHSGNMSMDWWRPLWIDFIKPYLHKLDIVIVGRLSLNIFSHSFLYDYIQKEVEVVEFSEARKVRI